MKNTLKHLCIAALLMLLARPPQAAASDDGSAGAVLAARRTAWSDRKESELLSKNPIFTGELLTTNQVGRLQVLFHDDSILMMAPDTQTRITEYLYSDENQGNISLELARGVTRIISGKVTEEGGMINVSTAQAEIGIRGTDVLIRSNADGVLEVAVLQGFTGKPTTVLLPGQPPERAVRLGHREGVIISGRDIDWMDRGQFNNFSQSNPNRDSGVEVAEYSPPAATPAPVYPDNPGSQDNSGGYDNSGDLGKPGNPATPPVLPDLPTGDVTATYSGSLNVASLGNGISSSGATLTESGFTFTVTGVNTSSPMLSSVNFFASLTSGGFTYDYAANGSGNIAPVTGISDFTVNLNNPIIDTTLAQKYPSGSIYRSADSVINSSNGNVTWSIIETPNNNYGVILDGVATRED